MKDCIKKGNNLKKYAAEKTSEADIKVNMSKARSEMFLIQEVKTSISYLEEILKVDVSNISDNEIKSRTDYMSKHLQQLDNLSKKMQNLFECADWKLQTYQKIKGCITTNSQSSQTRNLKIRVIQ